MSFFNKNFSSWHTFKEKRDVEIRAVYIFWKILQNSAHSHTNSRIRSNQLSNWSHSKTFQSKNSAKLGYIYRNDALSPSLPLSPTRNKRQQNHDSHRMLLIYASSVVISVDPDYLRNCTDGKHNGPAKKLFIHTRPSVKLRQHCFYTRLYSGKFQLSRAFTANTLKYAEVFTSGLRERKTDRKVGWVYIFMYNFRVSVWNAFGICLLTPLLNFTFRRDVKKKI